MRRVAGPELAAEVSNSGALGILAGLLAKGEDLRAQIRRVRELTDRPFGVNLWLHSELRPPVDPATLPQERVRAVQETLNVFRRRLGVAESTARPGPTPDTLEEAFEVILEERVPVWSTGLGEPDEERIARCHERGIRVIAMVATVRDAERVVSSGVDAVVAQGAEAGGHRSFGVKPASGEEAAVGTMVLVPEIVDAVGVPVVAAGGIADGRGIAAALALGASGAMLGTRFVATKEPQAAAFWKQAIVEARGDQTAITDVFTGLYARAIPNTFAAAYAASGAPVLPSLLQSSTAQDVYAASAAQGNRDYFPLLAGQSSGLIRNLPGAAEVVASLVAETGSALAAAAQRAGLVLRAES
jgi:nitronate monooxygenase